MAKNELAEGFNCETCGQFHRFSMYVYAHMRDRLTHKCGCGAKHSIFMGTAKQTKKGRATFAPQS